MQRILFFVLFFPLVTVAQRKQITLEDIYKNNTFSSEQVKGFTEEENLSLFSPKDIKDENGRLINPADYTVSADKKRILFFTGREAIYRRSSKATAYFYDATTRKTIRLNQGKILHPTFSPDGNRIAYVFDNNLYVYDVASGQTKPVTNDGKWNNIINGNCDWVYEEEFSFSQAYQWSPGGRYIAYYKFNESRVKEYDLTLYDDRYNKDYRYKYPKAGDSNSIVTINIYDLTKGTTVTAQIEQGDIYIPRIKWSQQDNKLVVFWMNRLQNQLKLFLTDAGNGKSSLLYEEKNKYYVDINDDWWFLNDGRNFIYGSEKNGWYRLYMQSMDRRRTTEITKMNYDVTEVNGVDEKNKLIYYTVAFPTPMDRNFFVSGFDGKKATQLTRGLGWHHIEMNTDFTKFNDYYSNINTPQTALQYNLSIDNGEVTAEQTKILGDNARLKNQLASYDLSIAQFIQVPNRNGDTLNGWIIKPTNFNPSQRYPVLFCNYGGPGSQQVANRYGTVSMWHQMLAERGFVVVSIDNTGTGFRGEAFKKKTYLQLGKYEIEDQIDAAKWLSSFPYIDYKNIGHWGWSFGGFMSSLAITKGAGIFSAAVAVAPVTNWRYYDNIYTERFMRTPQENAKGYDENSPINFVDKIRGKYLLIHGTADDNVHFQNSVQMVKALVKANVDFDVMYYPDKNHSIRGEEDNTTYHLWEKMTNWILQNLGNDNVDKTRVGNSVNSASKGL